ncbi:PREDICTED: transcription factor LBX1 [Gavialis gangeticus]|uniref:transcription factor LBX1 n=1 Tax=Gavialis gangeticus TaxID=94835 RepID=UPI00092E426D|nr:PREDICTED: transcription factor LBX1 [Gavialis gangeticus]
MTSKDEAKSGSVEERRRSPLDHLPPPANSNKPLTPFSIEDILNKPSVRRSYTLCGAAHLLSAADKHPPAGLPLSSRALLSQTSPLCALEELASKTFKGLEVSVLQAAEGKRRPGPARPGPARPAGVITWFQNRRAKLKRDLEEMKADVESAKKLGSGAQLDIVNLAELEQGAEARGKSRSLSPALPAHGLEPAGRLQLSPASPLTDQPNSSKDCSEDEEDVEIDVDD